MIKTQIEIEASPEEVRKVMSLLAELVPGPLPDLPTPNNSFSTSSTGSRWEVT